MARPTKAYKNLGFLNSPAARTIRMLCEYEEPRERFEKNGIKDTIVMFGSARLRSEEEAAEQLAAAEQALAQAGPESASQEEEVLKARKVVRSSVYYEAARELARRMTEWGFSGSNPRRYHVCSGGGPGIMEAANRGAGEVAGGESVGLGISLPFEEDLNRYVTPGLDFEF
ncbi:MAG: lysine decarboxylase, partial [Myxococcota bacterium]|nr:lysine decarboxylase [Myxococcota bacterium]